MFILEDVVESAKVQAALDLARKAHATCEYGNQPYFDGHIKPVYERTLKFFDHLRNGEMLSLFVNWKGSCGVLKKVKLVVKFPVVSAITVIIGPPLVVSGYIPCENAGIKIRWPVS